MTKMTIESRWRWDGSPTSVEATTHDVGWVNAREVGQAVREHLIQLNFDHVELRSEEVELRLTFERE